MHFWKNRIAIKTTRFFFSLKKLWMFLHLMHFSLWHLHHYSSAQSFLSSWSRANKRKNCFAFATIETFSRELNSVNKLNFLHCKGLAVTKTGNTKFPILAWFLLKWQSKEHFHTNLMGFLFHLFSSSSFVLIPVR